jgi:hypothetical protein
MENQMGRPPIGKKAMSGAERFRRWYEKHRDDKPRAEQRAAKSTADHAGARIVELEEHVRKLQAANRELEAELTRRKAQEREFADWIRVGGKPTPRPETASKAKLSIEDYNKLVRRIHPNKWVGLKEPALDRALTDAVQILEQLFEPVKEATKQKRQERARREAPVDWAAVVAAIERYAADRTTVTMNKVLAAIYVVAPQAKADRQNMEATHRCVHRTLIRLGFTASSTGSSFRR